MQAELFVNSPTGQLIPIHGTDPVRGVWTHVAFLPRSLPSESPALSPRTFNAVAQARAALATLNARAGMLPNPGLLRQPTLRIEAQSTSALEGTYAPLVQVLGADEEDERLDGAIREIVNYVRIAEHAFAWVGDGRPLTLGLLEDLQGGLVRGTPADTDQAGQVRSIQVAIGSRRSAPIAEARFVPVPPGLELESLVRDWVEWVGADHEGEFDPVVAAAVAHYQFETLHPFNDGNGRIGRLAIVLQLLVAGVLTEPTLSVSPWFEVRRSEYYDHLMAISTRGDWDGWVRFFADGLASSAIATGRKLSELLELGEELKSRVHAAGLRAATPILLVDYALGRSVFTVRQVEHGLGISYGRANALVSQLVDAGVLIQYGSDVYGRRFTAPGVLGALTS